MLDTPQCCQGLSNPPCLCLSGIKSGRVVCQRKHLGAMGRHTRDCILQLQDHPSVAVEHRGVTGHPEGIKGPHWPSPRTDKSTNQRYIKQAHTDQRTPTSRGDQLVQDTPITPPSTTGQRRTQVQPRYREPHAKGETHPMARMGGRPPNRGHPPPAVPSTGVSATSRPSRPAVQTVHIQQMAAAAAGRNSATAAAPTLQHPHPGRPEGGAAAGARAIGVLATTGMGAGRVALWPSRTGPGGTEHPLVSVRQQPQGNNQPLYDIDQH